MVRLKGRIGAAGLWDLRLLGLQLLGLLLLLGCAGCSSLPSGPRPDTELNSRTAGLHKLGKKQFQAGHLDKAQAYFDQALAIHAQVDDQAGVAVCFMSRGRVKLAREDADAAEADFRQAQTSLQNLGRHDLMAQCLAGLAAVDMVRGRTAAAQATLKEALDLPLAEGSRERAVLSHDLGSCLMQQGQAEAAREYLQAALDIHRDNKDRQGLATVHFTLAQLARAEGDPAAAVPHARRALALDKGLHSARGVRQDLLLLEALHRELGQDGLAEDYRRRAILAGG